VILVDHICASYCEDFVMPFKDNHRATVVGDTTAGTYAQTYFTAFDNGMQLNIAVTHEVFPDGSPFEGVGIAPDIALTPTIEDIRSRTDVVLERGVEALRSLRAR
jgi:carboxyl-terminal processing protease